MEGGFVIKQCNKCKRNIGSIGNKTLYCKKCGVLVTESLFTNKDEINKIAIDQIKQEAETVSIDIEIETDEHNKIVAIHYPDLKFVVGKILK